MFLSVEWEVGDGESPRVLEVAGDGGGGEDGVVVFESRFLILEIGFGGEFHLLLFFKCDGIYWGTVEAGFTVFDFGEVDVIAFGADEVDLVEGSFVVLFDDAVAVVP